MLTGEEVEAFVEAGFVRVAGAVPRSLADRCRAELWEATGCSPDDPSTWTKPVIRLGGFATPPFREAANTAVLRQRVSSTPLTMSSIEDIAVFLMSFQIHNSASQATTSVSAIHRVR